MPGGFAGSGTVMLQQPLAPGDNAFELAEVYASAVEHYSSIGDDLRAAECVERMIGELQRWDAVTPWAYRKANEVAQRRGRTLEAIGFFEIALDLEYRQMAEVVDLQKIRNDYGRLLSHYEWLSEASISLNAPAPGDLLARLVRCADRWRQFDAEQAPAICNRTAKVLREQRGTEAEELAWNYLTTPIALQPGQSEPWVSLATTLTQKGDWKTADACYRQAFAVEPTNPEILRDQAKLYERFGQAEVARQTMQRIIDGKWQPRFEPTVRWATGRVRGE